MKCLFSYREGTIKVGDRLLSVDGHPLSGVTLPEAQSRLRATASPLSLLCVEYDVSIMSHIRAAQGPLLVEIEGPQSHSLGLELVNTPDNSAVVIGHVQAGSIAERLVLYFFEFWLFIFFSALVSSARRFCFTIFLDINLFIQLYRIPLEVITVECNDILYKWKSNNLFFINFVPITTYITSHFVDHKIAELYRWWVLYLPTMHKQSFIGLILQYSNKTTNHKFVNYTICFIGIQSGFLLIFIAISSINQDCISILL